MAHSDWTNIRAGVLQGSILGPLLFLVFINDIVNDIGFNIRLFADDTNLYIIVNNPLRSAELLNADLEKISLWANTWLVTFNPAETESLLISGQLINPDHPPLYMQNQHIAEVETLKHLGLYLSSDCSRHQHIKYIADKAWGRINIVRNLKFKLDRKSLEIIYTSFIPPLLESGITVLNTKKNFQSYKLKQLE